MPTFYLSLGTQLTMAEITNCAGNISNYLLPHSTWGEPILPTLPGCAAVEFTSDEFTPHSDGWLCLQGAAGAYRVRQMRALPSVLQIFLTYMHVYVYSLLLNIIRT